MIIIENESDVRFSSLDKNGMPSWHGFGGKVILGTHLFVYIPSYKTIVERVVTGYKYYRSLKNCSWKQPWNDGFLYTDPLRPEVDPGVAEDTILFELETPNGGRTRQISALVDNDCCIWYYSAGHKVSQGYIYESASECYRHSIKELQGVFPITPAKDGVLNPQKMMLSA